MFRQRKGDPRAAILIASGVWGLGVSSHLATAIPALIESFHMKFLSSCDTCESIGGKMHEEDFLVHVIRL
jgi:hypothetical protein